MQKIVGIYSIKIGKLNTEQSCQSVLVLDEVKFVLQAFQQDNFLSKTYIPDALK